MFTLQPQKQPKCGQQLEVFAYTSATAWLIELFLRVFCPKSCVLTSSLDSKCFCMMTSFKKNESCGYLKEMATHLLMRRKVLQAFIYTFFESLEKSTFGYKLIHITTYERKKSRKNVENMSSQLLCIKLVFLMKNSYFSSISHLVLTHYYKMTFFHEKFKIEFLGQKWVKFEKMNFWNKM